MVADGIKKMKQVKAGGPSGVIVKIIKTGGRETVTAMSELVNQILYEKNIPEDWKDSVIINCYKGKVVDNTATQDTFFKSQGNRNLPFTCTLF